MKATLFINPASGNPAESAVQLVELLRHLNAQNIQPEVVLVQPEMRLSILARSAVRKGAKLVIVSGGDGTIENVALGMVGSSATLGIVPTGTRNNLARSLGIPANDIPAAAELLRKGRRIKIDVGLLRTRQSKRYFLEAGSVGLASAIYPTADDIQHGDLGKIPEFISTFVSHNPSEIHLRLDHHRAEIITHAHMVLVANMPFMGANFQIAPDIVYDDRHLDIFVYSNLSKLDLIGQAIQLTTGASDASRIQRYRSRKIEITTNPEMTIMADGVMLGEGPVSITLLPHALKVIAGLPAAVEEPAKQEIPQPEPVAAEPALKALEDGH
ncbi:MAG TPA: YegS/Rv2252/BmrU family lipid kinase [Anaerolineae bacterium]